MTSFDMVLCKDNNVSQNTQSALVFRLIKPIGPCSTKTHKSFSSLPTIFDPPHLGCISGPFSEKCDRCERSFHTASQLRDHYRIHTGEKPFSCSMCNKSYSLRGNLTVSSISSGIPLEETLL